MKIVLPEEKPISWNRFYSGLHWTKRRDEVARVRITVLAALPLDVAVFTGPVKITVTAFFAGRVQDPDNVCSKLYIDALCDRVLEDDTYKHVHSVTTVSRKDRKNPRVEIEIQPAVRRSK